MKQNTINGTIAKTKNFSQWTDTTTKDKRANPNTVCIT